jgi:hypothetical protein
MPEITAKWERERWFMDSPENLLLEGGLKTFWSDRCAGPTYGEMQTAVDAARNEGVADLKYYADLARRYSFAS